MAEDPVRLTVEVHVGEPSGDVVLVHRWKVSHGLIDRVRQPAGRIVVTEQHVGDRRSTFFPGPEHVEDGRGGRTLITARPTSSDQRNRPAVLKHDGGSRVRLEHPANQLHLDRRQVDEVAVDPFALQDLVDADEQDAHVGLPCDPDRLGISSVRVVAFENPAPARIEHLRRWPHSLSDAVERLDEGRIQAGVVGAGLCEVGERADDRNRLDRSRVKRQEIVAVRQQHDRLTRCPKCHLTVRGRVDLLLPELLVGHHLGRIEFTEPESDPEHTAQRLVDLAFGEQTLGDRAREVSDVRRVVEIAADQDSPGRRFFERRVSCDAR